MVGAARPAIGHRQPAVGRMRVRACAGRGAGTWTSTTVRQRRWDVAVRAPALGPVASLSWGFADSSALWGPASEGADGAAVQPARGSGCGCDVGAECGRAPSAVPATRLSIPPNGRGPKGRGCGRRTRAGQEALVETAEHGDSVVDRERVGSHPEVGHAAQRVAGARRTTRTPPRTPRATGHRSSCTGRQAAGHHLPASGPRRQGGSSVDSTPISTGWPKISS